MITTLALFAAIAGEFTVDPVAVLFDHDVWRPNSRQVALAVNHLIKMGEKKALADLACKVRTGGFGADYDAGRLCRILYVADPGKEIELYGWGSVSGRDRIQLKDWPEFPCFQQNGVWFELPHETLKGGGPPFSFLEFVEDCKARGRFRSKPVPVPSRQEAEAALDRFLTSRRWIEFRKFYAPDLPERELDDLWGQTQFQDFRSTPSLPNGKTMSGSLRFTKILPSGDAVSLSAIQEVSSDWRIVPVGEYVEKDMSSGLALLYSLMQTTVRAP